MARARTPRTVTTPAPAAPAARPRNPNRVPLAQQTQSGDSFGAPRNQFGGNVFQGAGTLTGAALAQRQATEARVRQATLNALDARGGPNAIGGRVTGGGGLRMADAVRANLSKSIGAGTSSGGG